MEFPFEEVDDIMSAVNSKYSHINRGGCGIMASIIGKNLSKFVDIKIVTGGGKGNIDKARNLVSNNTLPEYESHDVIFRHVWVEFRWEGKWYAIDSNGIFTRRKIRKRWGQTSKGSFTVEEMEEIGTSTAGWNTLFSRRQIRGMKNLMARRFNKLIAVS